MSTQAIRAVLLRYKESCGEEMLLGQRDILNAATAEVEAVERAAKDLSDSGDCDHPDASVSKEALRRNDEALALMERIAKDAP